MESNVLERAGWWFRRVKGTAGPLAPRGRGAVDSEFLDALEDHLTEGVSALRALVSPGPGGAAGLTQGERDSMSREIERLEDLAGALAVISAEARGTAGLRAIDLGEALARELRSFGARAHPFAPTFVNTPADLPAVLARPSSLARLLRSCLEVASASLAPGGRIAVRLAAEPGGEGAILADFEAVPALARVPPRELRRIRRHLSIAARLASAGCVGLTVRSNGTGYAPRLRLRRTPLSP